MEWFLKGFLLKNYIELSKFEKNHAKSIGSSVSNFWAQFFFPAAKPPHASLARAAPSLARTAPSLARAVPKPLSVFANDLLTARKMPAIAGCEWKWVSEWSEWVKWVSEWSEEFFCPRFRWKLAHLKFTINKCAEFSSFAETSSLWVFTRLNSLEVFPEILEIRDIYEGRLAREGRLALPR